MRITRPIRIRRGIPPLWIACGCAAILGVCGLVAGVGVFGLLIARPEILFSVIGLAPEGDTAALFEGVTPAPTIVVQNPVEPASITIYLPQGAHTLSTDSRAVDVIVGSDTTGMPVTVLTFTESGLLDICRQRSPLCAQGNAQFQNINLDLRPGGLIVYADANLSELGFDLQQKIGIVMTVASNKAQLNFAGVDIHGALFSAPLGGLQDRIATVERDVNDFLNQLTVDAGNGQRSLSEIQISDNTLTLVMR